MNAQPLVIDSNATPRAPHPLRQWRLRQLVWDEAKNCRRSMRLEDVQRIHGVPTSTWAGWEKWPDQAGFRRPDEENMGLLFRITKGEIHPNLYYPIDRWSAAVATAGSGS